jgi:hypothetical protein
MNDAQVQRIARRLYNAARRVKLKQGEFIWGHICMWEHEPSETRDVWTAVAKAAIKMRQEGK